MAVNAISAIGTDDESMDINPDQVSAVSQPIKTPFSQLLDTAVGALNELSAVEAKSNQLTEDYLQGKASLEEVMMETNRLSINMQLAVTVINTTAQTFKEIQQMQV